MSKSPITEEKVLKSVRTAGTTTYALGIFAPIMTFFYYILFGGTPLGYVALFVALSLAFFLPLVFMGKKIKNDEVKDIEEIRRRINKAGIYMVILIIVGLIIGVLPGIFAILATIELFSAKGKINQFMKLKGN